MLFLKPQDADAAWERIARSTANGQLGCSAKINPTKDRNEDAVCCIYTPNFADQEDVKRVLVALQAMGLVSKTGYKPDFFTHLGIYKENPWRLSPTLYSVKQVLGWKAGGSSDQQGSIPKKKKIISWNETSQVDIKSWLMTNRPGQFSEAEYELMLSWKPRIDEPSKPKPSSNISSLNSRTGTEKCCQRRRMG